MKFKFPGISIIFCLWVSALPVWASDFADYRVLETADHDPSFFTQGFELRNELVYESSGLYGKSKVRKYRAENNRSLAEIKIADSYFAEGLTLLKDTLYLLTWQQNTLLLLDPVNLNKRGEIKYRGEGWGLANNGKHLIMSNGSDTIFFRNATTFEIEREIKVSWKQQSISRINELEFAGGYLWANVFQQPIILKINPSNGNVVAIYDLQKLAKLHTNGRDERVLNGIAYDKNKKGFWVTGKLWPKRYLIEF